MLSSTTTTRLSSFFFNYFFVIVPLVFSGVVLSEDVRINSVHELIAFSNDVNSGNNYSGTTVYLEADIDFTGDLSRQFNPIGVNDTNLFQGTFDGQGHLVSNLTIETSLKYVGLFGFSEKATIRNVIMDSSCSVVSRYEGSDNAYVGGISGYCKLYQVSGTASCKITNSVNLGSVSFDGNTEKTLYLGGIIGRIDCQVITNCANYGPVTASGNVGNEGYVGGIVGWAGGGAGGGLTGQYQIKNCLNYGTITHSCTSKESYAGGILGNDLGHSTISFCVNGGSFNAITPVNSTGEIAGFEVQGTKIEKCYSLSEVLVTEPTQTTVNTTALGELNNNGLKNKWITNIENKRISFNFGNHGKGIVLSSQLILLPDLATGWTGFSGWFTDSTFKTTFDISTPITEDTVLYGRWDKYLVSFDVNGGNESSVPGAMNLTDELPAPTRTGHSFGGWFTEKTGGEIVTEDSIVDLTYNQTLYAHWTINNYTVTFDFDNGTVEEKILAFGEEIKYPENLTRTGYEFLRWNSTITEMPAHNLTIKALWKEIPTEFVEIVFAAKNMNEKDVREIISKFTQDADYEIKAIEPDDERTRVILKFNNADEAEDFYRGIQSIIRAYPGEPYNLIIQIGFFDGGKDDFSFIQEISHLHFVFLF